MQNNPLSKPNLEDVDKKAPNTNNKEGNRKIVAVSLAGLSLLAISIMAAVKLNSNKAIDNAKNIFDKATDNLDATVQKYLDTLKISCENSSNEEAARKLAKASGNMLYNTQRMFYVLNSEKPRPLRLEIDPKKYFKQANLDIIDGKIVQEVKIDYSHLNEEKTRIDGIIGQWKDFYNNFVQNKNKNETTAKEAVDAFLSKHKIQKIEDREINSRLSQAQRLQNRRKDDLNLLNAAYDNYAQIAKKYGSDIETAVNKQVDEEGKALIRELVNNIETADDSRHLKFVYYDDPNLDIKEKVLFVETNGGIEIPGIFVTEHKKRGGE